MFMAGFLTAKGAKDAKIRRKNFCLFSSAFALFVSFAVPSQSAEMFPFVLPWDDAAPSVTNISAWLEKPAGRDGFVSVRDGRCLVVRGRIPDALLKKISDVVLRSRVARGSIRAVRGAGHARLVIGGMDEGTSQRLRNVFGTHPVQKLRAARVASNRNLGQLLGFAWLAWLLVGLTGMAQHG